MTAKQEQQQGEAEIKNACRDATCHCHCCPSFKHEDVKQTKEEPKQQQPVPAVEAAKKPEAPVLALPVKKEEEKKKDSGTEQQKEQPEMVKLYFCIAEMQNDILKVTRQTEATEEQIKKLTQEKQRLLTQVGQMNGELAKLIIKFDLAVQKLKDCVQ